MSRSAFLTGVMLGLVCWCGPAAAADVPASQPTTSAPAAAEQPTQGGRQLLLLKRLILELGFSGSYDEQSTRFATRERDFRWSYHQANRAQRFEETIGFRADGALFGEQWVLFDANARWGLTQERYHESRPGPDRSTDPHGQLLEYGLNLTFFPRGRISGNAFAQRYDDRVPRAFQPSLDRSRERYGASLYFSDPKLPMRLTFEHSWDELNSRTHNALDDEQRGRDRLSYEATWQIATDHSLRLEYEYDDRREEYAGSDTRFDTNRHYVVLNHVLRFGDRGRSAWENLLRLQDESGDLARDNYEASSRLRLQHTDALASNYRFQFLRDSFQGLTTDTWRGEVGLTHSFAELLTTTAQVYGLQQSADKGAEWSEWGGLLNLSCAHDNRWGRFSSNLSYNHASTNTRSGTRRGVVIGESVTLRDPLPAYLSHTDVNPLTILVTDGSRTRTYLPGRDYVVVPFGSYMGLRRVPSGAIPDRATVLVSYTYRVTDDYDLRRHRVDLRVQQAFNFGLTPYYATSIQHEDVDPSRFDDYRGRDVNRHRIGATYRRQRWSVGTEYEYNDDAIDPYQAVHANGDAVFWQAATRQLDGKVTASQFWFSGADGPAERDALVCDAGLSYRHVLARDLQLDASAVYRYEDDELYGITHGVDLSGALEWRIGYFWLRFEAEYDMLDLPGSRDNAMSFWIKLKRDIPVLGARQS